MLAKVCSATLNDSGSCPVEVEVNAGSGDTITDTVSLPDTAEDYGWRPLAQPGGVR